MPSMKGKTVNQIRPHLCCEQVRKHLLLLLLLFLTLPALADAPDHYRQWTAATGYTATAAFVKLDHDQLTLRKKDQQYITLPVHKLSTTDQEIARSIASGKYCPDGSLSTTWLDEQIKKIHAGRLGRNEIAQNRALAEVKAQIDSLSGRTFFHGRLLVLSVDYEYVHVVTMYTLTTRDEKGNPVIRGSMQLHEGVVLEGHRIIRRASPNRMPPGVASTIWYRSEKIKGNSPRTTKWERELAPLKLRVGSHVSSEEAASLKAGDRVVVSAPIQHAELFEGPMPYDYVALLVLTEMAYHGKDKPRDAPKETPRGVLPPGMGWTVGQTLQAIRESEAQKRPDYEQQTAANP